MPRHTLPAGNGLIDGLVALGEALGYIAERELPVARNRRNPPAVDVAWLSERGQDYRLMIFEVESRLSNAAANNAVKVFGQPNERFERPLFFFHIFLAGGQDSSRVDTLRPSFGLHNYRIYRLDHDDTTRLIVDVLSQHRRLRQYLSLPALLVALTNPAWVHVDRSAILNHAEKLGFNANFLGEYAKAGAADAELKERFFRMLLAIECEPGRDIPYEYDSYIGRTWDAPIHIGLLAMRFPESQDWLARLRHWQERTSYFTMIGPHLGLSRDYDDFVLGSAPVLWALTAALMRRVNGAAAYIEQQMVGVLESLTKARAAVSFFTGIWTIHIAVAANDGATYERVRKYINDRGGISQDLLYEPPNGVSVVDRDDEWEAAVIDDRGPVPDIATFRRHLPSRYGRTDDPERALVALAFGLLTDDRQVYEWGPSVALLLHAPAGLTLRRAAV
jgi:hypothetical protein